MASSGIGLDRSPNGNDFTCDNSSSECWNKKWISDTPTNNLYFNTDTSQ